MPEQYPVQPEAGLAGALWQAERGWRILPVKPNTKTPHITKWQHLATSDEATIRKWWGKWPGAWIGGACGPGSGRLCIDVDQHGNSDGVAELEALAVDLGELPDTEGQKTPRGWHLFFAWPEGEPITNAAGELLPPGLDVRGQGGYVVLAPSPGYSVEPGLLQELPAGYLGALRGSQVKGEAPVGQGSQTTSTLAWLLAHPATEGGRNQWITSVAGHLAKQTPFEDGYLEQVRVANLALQPPLEDEEIDKTAASVWKAEQRKPAPAANDKRFTDLGNARRLVELADGTIRYCEAWGKWLAWDGKRYAVDNMRKVNVLCHEMVRNIYREAADAGTAADRKALTQHAIKSESEARIRSALILAKDLTTVDPEVLDQDPLTLNVSGGLLRPHRPGGLQTRTPDDMVTRLAPVEHDPSAECPRWLEFLDKVLAGDEDLVEFVQRALGYSLTGITSERVLFILHGGGRNGKSTFLNTIQSILGDYAARTPVETLIGRREGTIPNDLARLAGVRFVVATESEEGRTMAEAQVKTLTGGEPVMARFMRAEWFQFTPQFKVWLATNHLPRIKGTDAAIWDRIRLVPFHVRITEQEEDKELAGKLRAEASGILNWMIEGCQRWHKDGLSKASGVLEATASYRDDQDILGGFLADACELGDYSVRGSTLYGAYAGWCVSNGERPKSGNEFGAALRERGFLPHRTKAGKTWEGLNLRGPEGQIGLDE